MDILNQIPKDYFDLIKEDLNISQVHALEDKLKEELKQFKVTPQEKDWFKAFELCPLNKVKVVILGQDPYPTFGHAHGLAFSTEDFVQPFPKSLRNIFVEIKRSIPAYEIPLTGNLSQWAHQGVLLLNTVLTTRVGEANAHKTFGWECLTELILKKIAQSNSQLIGVFWGNQAQEYAKFFSGNEHVILKSSHPSPLSSYRGFNGCNHFVEINEALENKGFNKIVW